MAVGDDIQAVATDAAALATRRDAITSAITNGLFARLRPAPVTEFLTDAELTACCLAFAGAALRAKVPPGSLT